MAFLQPICWIMHTNLKSPCKPYFIYYAGRSLFIILLLQLLVTHWSAHTDSLIICISAIFFLHWIFTLNTNLVSRPWRSSYTNTAKSGELTVKVEHFPRKNDGIKICFQGKTIEINIVRCVTQMAKLGSVTQDWRWINTIFNRFPFLVVSSLEGFNSKRN
jgi:hypothetical protein